MYGRKAAPRLSWLPSFFHGTVCNLPFNCLYFEQEKERLCSMDLSFSSDKNLSGAMNPLLVFPFFFYLLFMIAIGWYFYARTKNISDYILGGRSLNSWVAALSAQASDMSGWLLLGLPGYAYLAGIEAFWIAFGLAVGTFLNWTFVAPRLRSYTQKYGESITLPQYFENRFNANNRILRLVSALFILIFFLI